MMKSLLLATILASTTTPFLTTAKQNMANENWSEAIENFNNHMKETSEQTSEMLFDLGVALYRDGQFEHAANTFSDSIVATEDPTLQLSSAYNRGNAIFQHIDRSASSEDTDVAKVEYGIAIKQLYDAIALYRDAINTQELDESARANAEVVWQLAKDIERRIIEIEQEEQEQNEDSAEQQEDSQEKNDEGSSSSDQQRNGEQSKDGDQPQDDESSEQMQQDANNSTEQKNLNDESEESNEDAQSDDNQKTNEDGAENSSEPKSLEDLAEGELKTSENKMNQPKENLKTKKDEGERLSEAQADRLLQLIRDKEQQRQKELAARREANRTSDGKDW